MYGGLMMQQLRWDINEMLARLLLQQQQLRLHHHWVLINALVYLRVPSMTPGYNLGLQLTLSVNHV